VRFSLGDTSPVAVCAAPTRRAVGFRSRKRHSFSRKRKRAAGALRIPPFARPPARPPARPFTRSLVGPIDRDSRVPAGRSAEAIRSSSVHPAGRPRQHRRRILHASEIPPPVPRLYFRSTPRGRPRNIIRSRHSFFTVDRRRGPRDNNGGEERFATAITLAARDGEWGLRSGGRGEGLELFLLLLFCSSRSLLLARPEGGRRVGLAG